MPNPRTQPEADDLHTSTNLKRIDDLEDFRKEYDGKAFDNKVLQSIKDSSHIKEEIKKVSWQTIREKIVWAVLGGAGIVLTDLLIRVIPHILASLK